MVLYIPVTKKGMLDSSRVALSEKKYNAMLEAQKEKYAKRFAVLKEDLQEMYDYLVNAGETAVTKDTATSKRGAVYSVWFPYSVAYERYGINVTTTDAAEALKLVLEGITTRIYNQEKTLQTILYNIEKGYIKMVTEEDELEEKESGTDLEEKFRTYTRNDQNDTATTSVSDPLTELDNKFNQVSRSDGKLEGIKEQY